MGSRTASNTCYKYMLKHSRSHVVWAQPAVVCFQGLVTDSPESELHRRVVARYNLLIHRLFRSQGKKMKGINKAHVGTRGQRLN